MSKCFKCPAFPCHWHYWDNPEELCSPEDKEQGRKTLGERVAMLEQKVKVIAAAIAKGKT